MHYLKENPFPPRIIPSVEEYFSGMSNYIEKEKAQDYRNINKSIKKEDFIKKLQKRSPFHHSLTRDTCSITRLGASNKINVVPPKAWAEIDCRILPDRKAESFIMEIEEMMKQNEEDLINNNINNVFIIRQNKIKTKLLQAE